MALRGGGFDRKSKTSSEVPSSSLADIAMLLLIFFMVTTVFRSDKKRDIQWPEAEAAEKIDEKNKNILNIWLEKDGGAWLNDRSYAIADLSGPVSQLAKRSTESRMVISLRADRETPYRFVHQMQKELVSAGVVHLVIATELERNMQEVRR